LACQLANVPVAFSTGNGPPLVKASTWLRFLAFSRFARCLF
jgi:hypothetical protein